MTTNKATARTRNAIEHAFLDLMKTKPYTGITVREITEAVDINRSTFYNHYQDIYDLISCIENRIIEEVKEKVDKINREGYVPGQHPQHVAVFKVLLKYEEECRVLMSSTGDINFLYKLNIGIYEALRTTWFRSNPPNPDELDMFIAYITSGIIGLFRYRLDGHDRSAEELGWFAGEITNSIDEAYVRGEPNG